MSSFNLSSQKWKNRVLLVFAPSADNHSYQQQIQLFNQHQNGFTDRDLVLVQVLATNKSYANGQLIDQSSAAKLRNRFGVDKQNFRVILVGKDGGVKRSDTTPVRATAIFEQIDREDWRLEIADCRFFLVQAQHESGRNKSQIVNLKSSSCIPCGCSQSQIYNRQSTIV